MPPWGRPPSRASAPNAQREAGSQPPPLPDQNFAAQSVDPSRNGPGQDVGLPFDPAFSGARVTAQGTLDEDLLCKSCGYALRGLFVLKDCPECGLPVAASLRRERLSDSALPWLRTVRRGFGWAWIFAILGIGSFAVVALFGVMGAAWGAVFSGVLLGAGKGWAIWQFTTPEIGIRESDGAAKRENLRRWTRWTALATVGASVTAAVLDDGSAISYGPFASSQLLRTAQASIAGISTLAWLVGTLVSMSLTARYVRGFAERAGNASLKDFAATTAVLIPVFSIFLACVFGLGALISFVLWMILLVRAESMFEKAIADARFNVVFTQEELNRARGASPSNPASGS